MDKEITANWARETTKKIHGDKVRSELIKCGAAIRNAVSHNKSSTSVTIYADNLTLSELKSRGFEVKQHDEQRDGSWLDISWK